MKVFKMDDYDWVASETIGQAIDYYLSETGCDYEDLEVKECDIDEEGMWWIIDEFPDGVEIKNYKDTFILDGIKYGYFYDEKAKHITFAEAISLMDSKFPYIIASTEM